MKATSLAAVSFASLVAVACAAEVEDPETDLLYSSDADQSGQGDMWWAMTSAILTKAEKAGGHVLHPAAKLAAAGEVKAWIACDVTSPEGIECSCGGSEDCKVLQAACGERDSSCNPEQTSCTCEIGESPRAMNAVLSAAEADNGHVFHGDPELAVEGEVLEWIGCDILPSGDLVCICVGREDCKILKGACGDEYWDCNPDETECVCLPE